MPTRSGPQVAQEPNVEVLTVKEYKSGDNPVWCHGCGDFGGLSATYKALASLQLQRKDVVVVSGIGCSSRTPYFLSTFGFHGGHGRSLPLATGMKLATPARRAPHKADGAGAVRPGQRRHLRRPRLLRQAQRPDGADCAGGEAPGLLFHPRAEPPRRVPAYGRALR